ncbi:GTP-binding protein [Solwaraspora sp. WMMA2065]|uniref:CobW family GTP-binding protein n=1 Tax=Solwaraspora sp. WMMA2065 TaxID=3015166 RepID=UPI00259B1F2F|nr:GTP-binding protein [Solwaraspora sp. WMMA2065]WJK36337.1 GTP-binding protein [Solwaraspora sp. WMMA2065]
MSTNPTATASAPDLDQRPAVTVLTSFSEAAAAVVARQLLSADKRLLVVCHDISAIRSGRVRRTVRGAEGLIEDTAVELVHGCVSCTLREDILPTLTRLAGQHPAHGIVLVLPTVVEPEAVAAACAHCLVDGAPVTDVVRFDSYVTVVDAASLLDDLTSTDDLRDRQLHAADDDHRAVAEVVVRQIEYADTVVSWERSGDPFEQARLSALLYRLAPWARHLEIGAKHDTGPQDTGQHGDLAAALLRTGRHDPAAPGPLGRALEGFPIAVHAPDSDCGVVSLLFETRRPFHPQRLHDALEDLTEDLLRGRGQLWIASQPDAVVGFEFAGGGVAMGSLGYWLAALPADRWGEASDYRRIAADLSWDPYYGDRRTALAFVGLRVDATALTDLLTACLLTDDEIADGFDRWRDLPDPFAGCFPLDDDTAPAHSTPAEPS